MAGGGELTTTVIDGGYIDVVTSGNVVIYHCYMGTLENPGGEIGSNMYVIDAGGSAPSTNTSSNLDVYSDEMAFLLNNDGNVVAQYQYDENADSWVLEYQFSGTQPPPSVKITLNDIKKSRNQSTVVVADKESTLGLTDSAFFSTHVFLTDGASETITTGTSFKIFINKSLSKKQAIYAYVHELNNALYIDQNRSLRQAAKDNAKNAANKLIYIEGMAGIEALGIFAKLQLGHELNQLGDEELFTTALVNAYVSYVNHEITLPQLLAILVNYIKSGDAKDEAGNSILQGYIDYYDAL